MNNTPKWFDSLHTWSLDKNYKAITKPHLKVTISVQEPEHDGYCSEVEESDSDTYITRIYYKDLPFEWDENEIRSAKFSCKIGCRQSHDNYCSKSGYCKVKTHIRVTNVTRCE
jgi:hypothetical protein